MIAIKVILKLLMGLCFIALAIASKIIYEFVDFKSKQMSANAKIIQFVEFLVIYRSLVSQWLLV